MPLVGRGGVQTANERRIRLLREGKGLLGSAGGAPVDLVQGGLVGALDDEFIDADMGRAARDPKDCFGDVFGGQGDDAFINLLCFGFIAFESDDGELGFGHAGIDGGDTQASAAKFEAQGLGDLQFGRLGTAVGSASFVGDASRDGADVDDAAFGAVHQWKDGASHSEDAEGVDLEHRFPILVPGRGDRVNSESAAGIVDEAIDTASGFPGPIAECVDAGGVGDIENVGVGGWGSGLAAFLGEGLQPVEAAGAQQQIAALARKGTRGGGAEPGGRSSDQNPFIFQS